MTSKTAKIKVERVSKYGVLVEGAWWNFDKKSGIGPDDFGGTGQKNGYYEVEYNEGKEGGHFIKSVKNAPASAPKSEPKADEKPKASLSKEEWAEKDARIRRSGLVQAAVVAVSQGGWVANPSELVALAFEKAKEMEKWVLEG
jgi:hypothetical protein